MDPVPKTPTLVASTTNTYSCSIAESRVRERSLQAVQSQQSLINPTYNSKEDEEEVNYFKSAQWEVLAHLPRPPTNNPPGHQMEPPF